MLLRVTAILVACVAALPAQRPDQVLVVVNDNSPESRQIGEFYVARRKIPSANICRISVTTEEEIFRHVYDELIAAPIQSFLTSRGIVDKVLYIATTLGVPLKIRGSGGAGGDNASVDSELTLLYQVLHGRPYKTAGAMTNPFFAQRDTPFSHPQFAIYLVTRLAAYSVPEVKAMIDRSMAAENKGKVVIDLDGPGDHEGNNWLRTTALLLPSDRVILDDTPRALTGVKDVIGYAAWGSNDKNRKERFLGFGWLPGGIATEFVSTDGRTLRRPPDNWTYASWRDADRPQWFMGSPQGLAADYLHEGASGASGHVYEPYLQACPRPQHLFPAYLGGRTLAESYYLAIPTLSWQNIVLGDPLSVLR